MNSNFFRSIYGWLIDFRTQRKRRRGDLDGLDWESGLVAENDFWTNALTNPSRYWNIDEFKERTNPEFELQPELRALIKAPEASRIRILDVGSGPLTRIGKKWTNRQIEITATDPLAEKYNALMKRLALPLLVPVVAVHAEKLTESFPKNHFDLAYASNCLDHSYDPLVAIKQMLHVTKPGCYSYLWHFANEGKKARYTGLHQWNFDVVRNEFLISDGRTTKSLGKEVADLALLECEETTAFGGRVVIAKLKKH